jgi:hypothetical protein
MFGVFYLCNIFQLIIDRFNQALLGAEFCQQYSSVSFSYVLQNGYRIPNVEKGVSDVCIHTP